tara:strand:- start:11416 stop:11730 length:315 start_codon:yes stop_codon:yes gene_type:complete
MTDFKKAIIIYHLQPTSEGNKHMPNYDVSTAFVIAASSPEDARIMAQQAGGDETRLSQLTGIDYAFGEDDTIPFWTDVRYSDCKIIGISTSKIVQIIANVFNPG